VIFIVKIKIESKKTNCLNDEDFENIIFELGRDNMYKWDNVKNILGGILASLSVGKAISSTPVIPIELINPETNQEESRDDSESPQEIVTYSISHLSDDEIIAQNTRQIIEDSSQTVLSDKTGSIEPIEIPYSTHPYLTYSYIQSGLSNPPAISISNQNVIDYGENNNLNIQILIERIWEIYDYYFDGQEIPESDFVSEREKFVTALLVCVAKFTVESIAQGVIGNEAHEKFKDIIERLKKKSKKNIRKFYKQLQCETYKLIEALRTTEENGHPIRIRDIAQTTGIDKEISIISINRGRVKILGKTSLN
jgi:hypothetical protein